MANEQHLTNPLATRVAEDQDGVVAAPPPDPAPAPRPIRRPAGQAVRQSLSASGVGDGELRALQAALPGAALANRSRTPRGWMLRRRLDDFLTRAF